MVGHDEEFGLIAVTIILISTLVFIQQQSNQPIKSAFSGCLLGIEVSHHGIRPTVNCTMILMMSEIKQNNVKKDPVCHLFEKISHKSNLLITSFIVECYLS